MKIVRFLLLFLVLSQVSIATPPPSTLPVPTEHKSSYTPSSQEDHSSETQTPALPSSQEMTDSYQHAFIRMLLSLAGLLILVFGTFWVLRRLGKGKFRLGSSHHIQVLEKRPLSPKTVLYLVELDGKQVLVSESQLEVRALTVIEPKSDLQEG